VGRRGSRRLQRRRLDEAHIAVAPRPAPEPGALLLDGLEDLAEQQLVHLFGSAVRRAADGGGRQGASQDLRIEIDLGRLDPLQGAMGDAVAQRRQSRVVQGAIAQEKRSLIMA
jgi:hypothetical protein